MFVGLRTLCHFVESAHIRSQHWQVAYVLLATHAVDLHIEWRLPKFHRIDEQQDTTHLTVRIPQIHVRWVVAMRNHALRFLSIDQNNLLFYLLDHFLVLLVPIF